MLKFQEIIAILGPDSHCSICSVRILTSYSGRHHWFWLWSTPVRSYLPIVIDVYVMTMINWFVFHNNLAADSNHLNREMTKHVTEYYHNQSNATPYPCMVFFQISILCPLDFHVINNPKHGTGPIQWIRVGNSIMWKWVYGYLELGNTFQWTQEGVECSSH